MGQGTYDIHQTTAFVNVDPCLSGAPPVPHIDIP